MGFDHDYEAAVTRPPRLQPTTAADRSQQQQEIVDDLVRGPVVNIYTTLVRNAEAAAAMVNLGRTLRSELLPPRHREIMILRTGYNCASGYELAQHQRAAFAIGMSPDDMDRIAVGPDAEGWDPIESALCRACDELHTAHTIADDTWEQLTRSYDEAQLIQAVMLIGYYHLVSFALNSLGVPLEDHTAPFQQLP